MPMWWRLQGKGAAGLGHSVYYNHMLLEGCGSVFFFVCFGLSFFRIMWNEFKKIIYIELLKCCGGLCCVSLVTVSNRNLALFLFVKWEKNPLLAAESAHFEFLMVLAQVRKALSSFLIRHLCSSFLWVFLNVQVWSENHGTDSIRLCFLVKRGETESSV